MRTLDGDSANYISVGTSYLSASAAFTIAAFIRPNSLAQSAGRIMTVGNIAANHWSLRLEGVADSVDFYAISGGVASTFNTSSDIALTAADVTNGCMIGYRYDGASWQKWKAQGRGGLATVTRTVINAALTATVPTLSTSSTIFSITSAPSAFDIGEVSISSVALTDDQMQALMRGVCADQIVGPGALLAYWPMRGNTDNEPDYVSLPAFPGTNALTITGTCPSYTHPATYGADDFRSPNDRRAWVFVASHPDETIKAATCDLFELQDIDAIGLAATGIITNGDSISVAKSIEDGIGSAVGPSTVILATDIDTPAGLRPGLCTTYATAVALDRPVAFYRCSDPSTTLSGVTNTSVQDSGTRQIHAAVTGALTYQATGPLTSDNTKAITWNGSSSNYAASPSSVTALNLTKAVSVECWVKFAASSGNYGLVEYTTAAGTSNKQFLLFTSGSTIYWRGVIGAVNKDATYATGGLATASWTHIVGTYDGSNVRLYVNGTLRATTAASGGLDSNATGLLLLGRLGDSSYVLNGSMSCVAVYDHALSQTQIDRHYTIGTDGPREWREVPFALGRYERTSHEVVAELTGVIVDSDFSVPGRVTFHLLDRNESQLDTLIPTRVVNVDEHSTATDVGAPIPVAFGRGTVSAPAIGYDDAADPGGQDFVVSALKDAADATMTVRVRKVYYDSDPTSPGLGSAGEFYTAPGTITRVSDTVFGIGGAHEDRYQEYMEVRVTTDSGATWQYSYITSGGIDSVNHRITIADAIITASWDEIQINGEYIIDTTTYNSNAKDVLCVRVLADDVGAGVVVEVENSSITNPADVIEELLTNAQWSIGASVNSGLFATAVTDFANATLSTACNYVLGGDRQQRSLRSVLREVLSIRGAWLTDDGAGSWALYVDKAGATAWRTLGFADGYYNNIKALAYERQTPLDEAHDSLNLRFWPGKRTTPNRGARNVPFDFNSYSKSIFASVLGVGTTLVIANPWIRTHADASRVVSYQAKRMAAEDRQKGVVLGNSGRNIQLGEIINLRLGHNGEEGTYRVRGYRRGLGETTLDLVGYDSSMFTLGTVTYEDGAAGANTQADLESEATALYPSGTGINYAKNAGFWIGTRKTVYDHADAGVLPGWIVVDPYDDLTALSVTPSKLTVGSGYVTMTGSGVFGSGVPGIAINDSLDNYNGNERAMPLAQGELGIISVFCDSSTNWTFLVFAYDSNGATSETITISTIRKTGETNRLGWSRYYALFRPQDADTKYVTVNIGFLADTTIKLDAVQLERAARGVTRPSHWRPGFENQLILTKTESVTISSSGTTQDSDSSNKILEAGMVVVDVTAIVTTTIGSVTTISIGPKSGTATLYANATGKTSGTVTRAVVNGNGFASGAGIATANQITITANGANFNATGVVKLIVHYYLAGVPVA